MAIANPKQLVEKIKTYNPQVNAAVVESAYGFAKKAHQGQFRASGEPYITHPLRGAEILAEIRLDEASIVTALLHDVVEDTGVTLETVAGEFSGEVADLVDGVTKLTRVEMQSDNRQAENLRKLVLAMSEDIRVLIVKLADRMHNMRTIDHVKDDRKRERIALETLDIFAPLAERIGVSDFQNELEDRAFEVIRGDVRATIISRIKKLTRASGSTVKNICDELARLLKKNGLDAEVSGRQKTPYSIWKKMQKQKVDMETLADIMAFRIIVESEEDCYRTLGIIHRHFNVVMGRFKDYISTPKRNGYQSLHTGVIGPLTPKIEIQIRTPEMHRIAERGVAAHWLYKESADAAASELGNIKWLSDLMQILGQDTSSDEFLEHTQMEMYADQVFCFTPKGALIGLPKNSTTVDFAYAVHSDIGNSCVAAKVNGRTRQLATILNNGDQVEIVTGKNARPNPEWVNFVKTGRAKSLIRRFVRQEKQEEFRRLGRGLLMKAFHQQGRKFDKSQLAPALQHFDVANENELYVRVGQNLVNPVDVFAHVHPDVKVTRKKKTAAKEKTEPSLNIRGLVPGMAVHIGKCCHPLPGERIVGIVTEGKGLTVHRVDCQNLEKFHAMPELWVDIEWRRGQSNIVSARIELVLANRMGSLGSATGLIGKNKGNITNIQLLTRDSDFFKFLFEVEVSHVRHLTIIIAALRTSEAVESVERAK